MSCIVGLVDKNKVYIGCDSAGVCNDIITKRKDSKIFKNGDFIIGCTTSYRMIQLLRYSFKPPEINKKEIYNYMCTDFINEVRKCFKKGGYLQKYPAGDDLGGVFLVAHKDRLFFIDDDFQVGESHVGYQAAGGGEKFALGSLHTSSLFKKSEDRINAALEAAAFHCTCVCKPFLIYHT